MTNEGLRPVIAVLAVQGAFIEHEKRLKRLGCTCIELRQASDLSQRFDGLVLPGGESTVQGKLIEELGMIDRLRAIIQRGVPVLATCAGLILLSKQVVNNGDSAGDSGSASASDSDSGDYPRLATLPVTVRRNAYGRQLGSFHTRADLLEQGQIPMTFIRAPYVEQVGEGVEILAQVDGHIVAVRYGAQIAVSFHPELDASDVVHKLFLDEVMCYRERSSNLPLT